MKKKLKQSKNTNSNHYVEDLVLYLLSRNDLPSMTAGKELAHAHHAGVQLISKYNGMPIVDQYIKQGVANGADNFNTTITLEGPKTRIFSVVDQINQLDGIYDNYLADFIHDPTYPYLCPKEIADVHNIKYEIAAIKGNNVLLTREEMTMGWVLCSRNDSEIKKILNEFQLKTHNYLIYDEK